MTEAFKEAKKRTEDELKALDEEYKNLLGKALRSSEDGWNSPPAQLPSAGEIAMGIVFEPRRNTH